MKPELMYLVLVASWTGLLWLPYILDRLMVRGIADAVGYPENPKPQSPWAQRLMKAHSNAVENLAVFAALVLTAQLAGVTSEAIVNACAVYFWVRVLHTLGYTFAVPLARTLTFAVGWACQAVIAWQLLMK